jgi:hypothetical protein
VQTRWEGWLRRRGWTSDDVIITARDFLALFAVILVVLILWRLWTDWSSRAAHSLEYCPPEQSETECEPCPLHAQCAHGSLRSCENGYYPNPPRISGVKGLGSCVPTVSVSLSLVFLS